MQSELLTPSTNSCSMITTPKCSSATTIPAGEILVDRLSRLKIVENDVPTSTPLNSSSLSPSVMATPEVIDSSTSIFSSPPLLTGILHHHDNFVTATSNNHIPVPSLGSKRKPSFSSAMSTPKDRVSVLSRYSCLHIAAASIAASANGRPLLEMLKPRNSGRGRDTATEPDTPVKGAAFLQHPAQNNATTVQTNVTPVHHQLRKKRRSLSNLNDDESPFPASETSVTANKNLSNAPLLPMSPDFEYDICGTGVDDGELVPVPCNTATTSTSGHGRIRFYHAPCFSPIHGTTAVNPNYMSKHKNIIDNASLCSPPPASTKNSTMEEQVAGQGLKIEPLALHLCPKRQHPKKNIINNETNDLRDLTEDKIMLQNMELPPIHLPPAWQRKQMKQSTSLSSTERLQVMKNGAPHVDMSAFTFPSDEACCGREVGAKGTSVTDLPSLDEDTTVTTLAKKTSLQMRRRRDSIFEQAAPPSGLLSK